MCGNTCYSQVNETSINVYACCHVCECVSVCLYVIMYVIVCIYSCLPICNMLCHFLQIYVQCIFFYYHFYIHSGRFWWKMPLLAMTNSYNYAAKQKSQNWFELTPRNSLEEARELTACRRPFWGHVGSSLRVLNRECVSKQEWIV